VLYKGKENLIILEKTILTKSRKDHRFDKNINLEIQDTQQVPNRANSKSLGLRRPKLKISNKQSGLIRPKHVIMLKTKDKLKFE